MSGGGGLCVPGGARRPRPGLAPFAALFVYLAPRRRHGPGGGGGVWTHGVQMV